MNDLEKKLSQMHDKKDSGDNMSEDHFNAKMDVLKELMQMAMNAQGSKFHNGMQKVSVMAPDQDSLHAGLQKADEMVGSPEMEHGDPMADHDQEHAEEEMSAHPTMDPLAEAAMKPDGDGKAEENMGDEEDGGLFGKKHAEMKKDKKKKYLEY